MNADDQRKMDRHEASGLLPKLRKRVMSFCAPIWWESERTTILGNGTFCVVRSPKALFGVTNNHVLKIYERHKSERPDVFCQLGSGPFDPCANVISRSEFWDLATFSIPDLTLAHWGGEVFVDDEWPPAPMKAGDTIMLGGYPENLREVSAGLRPQNMLPSFVSMLARVADNWSDSHMAFCFDSSTWYWPQGISLEQRPNLSGASGGPCFRLVPEKEQIELSGFIYEAHQDFEIVRVRQAKLINADGTIAPEGM